MKKITVLLMALLLPLIGAVQASGLTITVYTEKSAWSQAVVGQYLTENFTDKILNPGITYTTEMGTIAQGRWQDGLNSDSSHPPQTTWRFDPKIYAYGGDWTLGGPGGSGNSLFVSLDEFAATAGFIRSSYYGAFWGFTSDTAFSLVTLIGGTGDHQQKYFLDNMVYSNVSPTAANLTLMSPLGPVTAAPLPGSVWLLAGGLLAIPGLRRLIG